MSYDEVINGGLKRYDKLTYTETTLGSFRTWNDLSDREDVQKFLEATKNLSEKLVVMITPELVALMTDDNGNLLEYNF